MLFHFNKKRPKKIFLLKKKKKILEEKKSNNIYAFNETKVYLLEGDANPEYTPEIFFNVYLSEEDALKDREQDPEVFHSFLTNKGITCPSCEERNNLGFLCSIDKKREWKLKKWFISFPEDQIGGNFNLSITNECPANVDYMVSPTYSCPRCNFWKDKW